MRGCGSTEGIDNSPGWGPQGRAGRHSAVLVLHSHITTCSQLPSSLPQSPPMNHHHSPPPPLHLHSPSPSLGFNLYFSKSYPAIFPLVEQNGQHPSILLILYNSFLDPLGWPHLNSSPSGFVCSNLQILQSAHTSSFTVPIPTLPTLTQVLGTQTQGAWPPSKKSKREGERGALSPLTHILPFLTRLQQWCNALGFSPSPHPVPAYPQISSLPSLLSFLSFSFPPLLVQYHCTRSLLGEVTASSG